MSDLVTVGQSRLTSQFWEKPKLKALVAAILQPYQDLLTDLTQLKTERWIATAVGTQLDGCGAIVGESRKGRTDDEYREAIYFKVFVNVSNGTPEDLIQGLRVLTKGDDLQYIERYPRSAILYSNGPNTTSSIKTALQDIAPAAIADLQIVVTFGEPVFRFSALVPDAFLQINSTSRLKVNGSRFRISPQGNEDATGATLGGIALAQSKVNGSILKVNGKRLLLNSPNQNSVIGYGYSLGGLYS